MNRIAAILCLIIVVALPNTIWAVDEIVITDSTVIDTIAYSGQRKLV